jgi:hypothetical protein
MLSPRQITAIYCIVDDLLKISGKKFDSRARLTDSEIITICIVAALSFGGTWLYSMNFLYEYGYISTKIDKSRLSRRIVQLSSAADEIFQAISHSFTQLFSEKEYIIDSTTLEICDNIRIKRCRMLQGKEFRGYKASFRRYFYGLRLQLLTTVQGVPVDYLITEGSLHDGHAMKEMDFDLPAESVIYSDAAYTDYNFEDKMNESKNIQWLSQRKSNTKRPRRGGKQYRINKMRKRIETVFSTFKNMFRRKLQAYDIESYMRKIRFFIYAFQLRYLI